MSAPTEVSQAPSTTDAPTSDVTVVNASVVTVVTAIANRQLVLTVEGVILGTVTDIFQLPPTPPTTMRLFIQNLPDGSAVSAQWQAVPGGPWIPFAQLVGGVYANFQVPASGQQTSITFVASVVDHGLYVDDPRLVLKTKT